jgi:3-hydroxymyristoyl/3-hydroxydecanoyl-(acyl carrier protein) dehydratase
MITQGLPSADKAAGAAPLDVDGLVCVSRPYFALEDLRQTEPGTVRARIPVEADPGLQAAVIGIGEVGRHLAIVGLCAAATINPRPGRHFYLARTADVEWLAPPTAAQPAGSPPDAGRLTGQAHAAFDSLRRATARAQLADAAGDIMARMTVNYDVLPHRVVTRLLGEPTSTPDMSHNPYASPIPLRRYRRNGDAFVADLEVDAGLCPGHFEAYPVLPVAILATAMTNLVDEVAARHFPRARWLAGPLHLSADQFARPGQTVTFTATPTTSGWTTYQCTAHVGPQTIATVDVELVVVQS